MNEPQTTEHDSPEMNREEMLTALFAHLIGQQSNMAMMLMGKVAHPQSGETVKDMDAARLFIDQIEMLEAKTKGNLSKEEERLLKQTLMSLRLTFVESMEASPTSTAQGQPSQAAPVPEGASAGAPTPATPSPGPEEHRTKFSKKY
jgi:hypothetical protein